MQGNRRAPRKIKESPLNDRHVMIIKYIDMIKKVYGVYPTGKEIAGQFGITPQTVSVNFGKLARHGYIKRIDSKKYKLTEKCYTISLTDIPL